MSKISRPDLTTDFTRFFLSAGENPNPIELSEEVLFTFPFAAPTIELRFPLASAVNSSLGSPLVNFDPVPADRYQLVHAVDMRHDDSAAAHFARISVVSTEAPFLAVAFATHDSLAQNNRLVARSIVVPPKHNIRLNLDSIAALSSIFGTQLFTEHNLAQPLMGLST